MSDRSLQRQLEERGTSFRQLVDEVRRAEAARYLSCAQHTDAEVAFLLGYGDPNSFYRAFRAWSGTSPGEFRKAHGVRSSRASG